MPETSADSSIVRGAVDVRRFPWLRPLSGAYAHDFASVAPLFAGDPADPRVWKQTIARVQAAPRDRAAIVRILGGQMERRSAHAHARGAASRLADPTTVAVVTGQQAGLFGGPLYTLLKAVTTIQLARRVASRHGVVAIPVFWVEAEDHDWDEVKSCRILDQEMQVRDIALPDLPGAGVQPVGRLVLAEATTAAIDELAALLTPSEFTSDLIERLRKYYRPGVTMSTAYASWLDDLFGRHGLVVFDSSDRAAKPLAADLFAQELTHPARTANRAREAAALMRSLGHEPQVEPADDATSLFYVDDDGRRPIRRSGDGFMIGDAARTAAELIAEASAHPERFSPNVLLRPLVQDRLFPTVCYVGGPSEIAYQAQLGGIYADFGMTAPLLCARATATILDAASFRFLDRHRFAFEALQIQDDSALNALLASQIPAEVDAAFADASREIESRLATLKAVVPSVDPTLAGATDTTVGKMRETLGSLHHKIIQASKRKDDTVRRQFLRTRALAFPDGDPQERSLAIPFFINRTGQAVVDRLIDTLPIDGGQHYLLAL